MKTFFRQILPVTALLILLKALPFATLVSPSQEAGRFFQPMVGYNSKDLLTYVAFIQQTAESGDWFLRNPFDQPRGEGHFFLPFFSLLGEVSRFTGLDAFWALELSRVPLLFLFFAIWWCFLREWIPNERERGLAMWLTAFAGGLEWIIDPLIPLMPDKVQPEVAQALWDLQGWNFFASAYNPLWIIGFIMMLVTLFPLARPQWGTGIQRSLLMSLGLLLTLLIHPYTGIMTAAILFFVAAVPAVFRGRVSREAWLPFAWALPAIAAWAFFAHWQKGDLAFRLASDNAWGAQATSLFWYPITFGLLALATIRQWGRETSPRRDLLFAWMLAALFLQCSSIANGYHYIPYLFFPIVVCAARYGFEWRTQSPRWAHALVALLLFANVGHVTKKSLEVLPAGRLPAETPEILQSLQNKPSGHVLCSPDLGNALPAFTPHSVHIGHWFLTPFYEQRLSELRALASPQLTVEQLRQYLSESRVRYIVVPSTIGQQFQRLDPKGWARAETVGNFQILTRE